jgi:dTDP-4-amino-4,6-dideoxygalactose transaminase
MNVKSSMQLVRSPRASAILYSLLIETGNKHPWLLPANICPIVPLIFLKAQIPFEFIDINADTFLMNLQEAESWVEKNRTGGILYAHTYGNEFTPTEHFKYIKSKYPQILIIDDRCLCMPSFELQTEAHIILFSTGYSKIAGLNSGGFAYIREDLKYQQAHLDFRPEDYKLLEKEYKENIKMHTAHIYTDSDWLETDSELPTWYDYSQQIRSVLQNSLSHREIINKIYSSLLPEEIQLPSEYQTWRFNIRVKNQKETIDAIFSKGLFASTHFASLAGIMGHGKSQHAEKLANEVINLFNDHHFNEQQAEETCKIIEENLS